MKKIIPLIGYYLGWIYPLAVSTYIILDHFLHIRINNSGPLDLGEESTLMYMFYFLIFAALTFLIYFIYYKKPLKNWGVLVNAPLYIVSIGIAPFYFEYNIYLAGITLLLSIGIITYTTVVSIDAMKRFE